MNLAELLLERVLDRARPAERDVTRLRVRLWRRLGDAAAAGRLKGPAAGEATADPVAAFLAGDASALDAVLNRHLGELLGYARKYLDQDEAEDAVQETFTILVEKAHTLRPGSNLRAFLFKVLRDEVSNIERRRYRHPTAPLGQRDDISADARSPYDEALRGERMERVAEAAEELCTPLEQQVIVLVYDGERSTAIAEALEITAANARKLKQRAIDKLRARLGGGRG